VLVRALWTWMLVGLSFVGFGILLIAHQPLALSDDHRMIGIWVALGVASAFVVHFLRRITGALAERDAELTEARGLAARQERLASLATMAAGAAHELSTPLGTVALAAKELERALTRTEEPELVADARLIRSRSGAAGPSSSRWRRAPARSARASRSARSASCSTRPCRFPQRTAGASRGLAGAGSRRSAAAAARGQSGAAFADHQCPGCLAGDRGGRDQRAVRGPGAGARDPRPWRRDADEILARIGEPFFTTKAPAAAWGSGCFWPAPWSRRSGGALHIDSVAGAGTCVRVTLPTDVSLGPEATQRSRNRSRPDGIQASMTMDHKRRS